MIGGELSRLRGEGNVKNKLKSGEQNRTEKERKRRADRAGAETVRKEEEAAAVKKEKRS